MKTLMSDFLKLFHENIYLESISKLVCKYQHVLIMASIILFALYIRLINLTDRGFYTDEAHEAILAKDLLNQFNISLLISEGEIFHIFITSLSFNVFGVSEFAGRLPVLIFGLATIYLAILFGSEIFNDKKVGLLTGFLISISAWHIKWSIILRPYSMLMFFGLLTMYFAYKAVKSNKAKYYYFMTIAFIFSLFTSRFSIVILLVIITYFAINNRLKEKHFLISISPLLVISGILISYIMWHNDFSIIYQEVSWQWWSHSNPSFYIDLLFNKLTIVSIFLLIVSCYWIIRKKDLHYIILIIYIISYLTILSFVFVSKIDRYLTIIIPFIYLLIGAGCIQFIRFVRINYSPSKLISVIIIFFVIVGDLAMLTPAKPTESYRDNYTVEWREACSFVEKNWEDGDYLITSVGEPVEFYFREPNSTLFSNWERSAEIIWNDTIVENSTVWLIVDHGRFYRSLQDWQRDWIWDNFELVWESEHNYVFKSSIIEKVWKDACEVVFNNFKADDIILTTKKEPVISYLGISAHDDWDSVIEEQNTSFKDAIWYQGLQQNTTVWLIADKDRFFNSFEYWQRDWIFRNFEIYWESEYTYIFINRG